MITLHLTDHQFAILAARWAHTITDEEYADRDGVVRQLHDLFTNSLPNEQVETDYDEWLANHIRELRQPRGAAA
jgi:hypothetical protein